MKLAFIKDWHDDPAHLAGNKDGMVAAWELLAKRHDVRTVSHHTGMCDLSDRDALIFWGSLDRPWHNAVWYVNIPQLLCFAGGPLDHPNLAKFDHILVESQVYEDGFRARSKSVSRAFGTNTAVFRPELRTPKVIDAIYPASFCFHKNQEVFARALGPRGLCVGEHNELSIVGACLKAGTPVLRKVSSAGLCDLFNMARTTVIPCGPNGGSQRTVLESMACGVPVVLADDNDKCREFIEESGFGLLVPPIPEAIREGVETLISRKLDPQVGVEYIRSKWTEQHYANAIEEAIKRCLSK